jgi:5-methylcytosine-specific restriction endonuclease McrA
MPRPLNPNNYYGWRKLVFQRDGHKCIECGSTERLAADHIKPHALYPELRYELSNGRTLCESCHKKTPTFGGGTRRKWKKEGGVWCVITPK